MWKNVIHTTEKQNYVVAVSLSLSYTQGMIPPIWCFFFITWLLDDENKKKRQVDQCERQNSRI